ncbi:uncharacterized protein LOC135394946 [Ornithodoros turicata]|uniref:uncharacterized protein LOC135394946 n=1 Tax=Ornithodoros turicata TaxID=34597 RepID=UPI00313929FF
MRPKEQDVTNPRVLRARPRKDASEDADDFEIGSRRRKRAPSQRDEKRSKRKRKSKNEPPPQTPQNAEIDETLSVVWTEKYKPSERQPFVGNEALIQELRDWLTEWKTNPVNRPGVSQSSDSEASVEGAVSNCMLLHGPPGSGKTSAVYYMAQELGYKVIEVNASSERPGKKILAQLQEATQSHHVEANKTVQGFQNLFGNQVVAKVPTNKQADSAPVKAPEKQTVKQKSRKKTVENVKTTPAVSNGTLTRFFLPKAETVAEDDVIVVEKQEKVSPKSTMLDYFGTAGGKNGCESGTSANKAGGFSKQTLAKSTAANKTRGSRKQTTTLTKNDDVEIVEARKGDNDIVVVVEEGPSVKNAVRRKKKTTLEVEAKGLTKKSSEADNRSKAENRDREKSRRENGKDDAVTTPVGEQHGLTYSSLTLILFDDVDVIFPRDEGFWSMVESFLSQTKKPVVFTATCHLANVRAKLPSHCLSIKTSYPGIDETRSFLQDVLTKEKVPVVSRPALDFLIGYRGCDLRQCLSQLQFENVGKHGSWRRVSLTNATHEEDLPKISAEGSTEEMSDLQCKYHGLGIDLLYLSIPRLLALPAVNTVAKPLNFGVSHWIRETNVGNGMNVSWLTDTSLREDETKDSDTKSRSEPHQHQSDTRSAFISRSLQNLSETFDTFSATDTIRGASSAALGLLRTSLPSERRQVYCDSRTSVEAEDVVPQALLLAGLSEAMAYVESGAVMGTLHKSLPADAEEESELNLPILDTVPSLVNFEAAVRRSSRLRTALERVLLGATSSGHSLCSRDYLPDYASALHQICSFERDRKDSNPNRGRRFLHYLNSCGVFLSGEEVKTLCEEWMC